jgi:hypothetical protein
MKSAIENDVFAVKKQNTKKKKKKKKKKMGLAHKSTAARLAVQPNQRKRARCCRTKCFEMLTFDTVTEERPTVRATLSLCDDYKVLGIVGAASSTESTAAALARGDL